MKVIAKILFCLCLVSMFVCALTTGVSASALDGKWKIREQLCYDSSTPTPTPTPTTPPPKRISFIFISTIPRERLYNVFSNDTSCSKSSYTITIKDNNIYSNNVKVGSVSRQGKTVIIKYDEDYLKSALNQAFEQLGVNITVEEVEYSFRGKLKNKIIKGTVEGYLTATSQGNEVTLEFYGKFTAKKVKSSN